MPIPRLTPEDTVLLVVDVQERLIPIIPDSTRLVTNCAVLLRMADAIEIPYLVTEQYPRGLGRTAEEVASAMTDRSRRIEKTRFSAANELVLDQLRAWRRQTVLVAGIEAHVCVLQTVLDLQRLGLQCFLVRDAISASQKEQIEPAIQRMLTAGAASTGIIGAMYELMGDSTHPAFPVCLQLAKHVMAAGSKK